jgi:proteasome lid subunit RPN8/RPN11
MTLVISPDTRSSIIDHARSEYPKESCGLIVDGVYKPCFNYAIDPLKDFEIAPQVFLREKLAGNIDAVVHSHPNGPIYPSERDMRGQIDTAVPWIIVPIEEDRVLPFTMWGDQLPIAPIIGREFLHGVHDCYSLIRDVFRLGKDDLAKQGIQWPFPPQELPNVPRDDAWWTKIEDREPKDLYADYIEKAGFRIIDRSEAREGDGFLCKLKSDRLNHGGLIVGGGLILHHLPVRLSRREAAGIWERAADMWVRYKPTENLTNAS